MNFFDAIRFTDGLIASCRDGSIDVEAVTVRGGAFIEWLVRSGDVKNAKNALRALAPYFRTCGVLPDYQKLVGEKLTIGEQDDFMLDMKDTIIASVTLTSANIVTYV